MIIKIDEDFYIEKDDMNFTLKESKHKKDKRGKDVSVLHGHFSTLGRAIEYLTHLKVDTEDTVVTLGEYIQAIKNERKSILEAIDGVHADV